ncbi:MAG: sugar phosphate isomerase/epimerase [Fimbriiglobus sp.]|jgi:hexulose-6-phosphate isomerase|nr:sugar phosphate isomerase/epimerase [Fimbriiglobus sp.]
MTSRRQFLVTSAALAAAPLLPAADTKKPKLRKAVKYGMIGVKGTPTDKFAAIKKLGFEGVEIDSPSGLKLDEVVAATKATGVVVHGVIDSVHWQDTLSHPDEKVRAKGLKALEGAIADAKTVGADTVLLVPGVVNKDVTYEQCWERSTAEVKKVLPTAEKAKIKICIETVWNNFITKPEQLVEYVDQFKSEWVAAYFDISNMIRYGVTPADWVRKLGKRMAKFDFKGYNGDKAKEAKDPGKGWCKIGEGTEDWPEVLKALAEVGYNGWATAEVGGGDEKVLADIAERMDKVLGLK